MVNIVGKRSCILESKRSNKVLAQLETFEGQDVSYVTAQPRLAIKKLKIIMNKHV